jgi:hypothetical protein
VEIQEGKTLICHDRKRAGQQKGVYYEIPVMIVKNSHGKEQANYMPMPFITTHKRNIEQRKSKNPADGYLERDIPFGMYVHELRHDFTLPPGYLAFPMPSSVSDGVTDTSTWSKYFNTIHYTITTLDTLDTCLAHQAEGHPNVVLKRILNGLACDIVAKVLNGTELEVLGKDGEHTEVRLRKKDDDDIVGWARTANLLFAPEKVAPAAPTYLAHQADGHLNVVLKREPNGDRIVDNVPNWTELVVLQEDGDNTLVKRKHGANIVGWARSTDLRRLVRKA